MQFFAKIALIFVQFLTLQKIRDLIIISGIYLFLTDSANYTIGDVHRSSSEAHLTLIIVSGYFHFGNNHYNTCTCTTISILETVANPLKVKLLYRRIALLYTCYIIMQNISLDNTQPSFAMIDENTQKGLSNFEELPRP